MSIEEFLDGMPSYDKRNFSKNIPFSDKGKKKPAPYISTEDTPSTQIIVADKSQNMLSYLQKQWGKEVQEERKRKREREDEKNQGRFLYFQRNKRSRVASSESDSESDIDSNYDSNIESD